MWNPLPSHLDEDHPAIEEQAEGSGVVEVIP